MKKHPSEVIVEAAFALRRAHQYMRSNGSFSREDISAVIWHESKLWVLCQEIQETNKKLQESAQ